MAGLFSADAWNKVWTYRGTFLLGLENTAVTALFALLLALVLGIVFGLFATSGKKPLAFIARVYVEVIQNTPVLLQMCFLYYALAFSNLSIGIIKTGIITLEKLIDLLSTNPRKRFGLPNNADFTVWDLEEIGVVDPADFLSIGKATPFTGWQIQGKCVATVCDGKIVYNSL